MNVFAVWGNSYQESHIGELRKFFKAMRERGFRVYVERDFHDYLASQGVDVSGFPAVDEIPADTECVMSIGGDGTFLQAAQWTRARELPILGINTGHLGYLASYSLDEAGELLETLEKGTGTLERRAVIKVESGCLPPDFWPYALNEVAVLKAATASMVTIHAEVDGRFVADYMSDGLVVATPTGSTAYNLSIGGPILQPTLDCIILSPIAAHSLTMRPVVISGKSHVSLRASSRAPECRVSLDGRSFLMKCGETLHLREADFKTVVFRRPDSNFANILRNKLGWGL